MWCPQYAKEVTSDFCSDCIFEEYGECKYEEARTKYRGDDL